MSASQCQGQVMVCITIALAGQWSSSRIALMHYTTIISRNDTFDESCCGVMPSRPMLYLDMTMWINTGYRLMV